MNHLNFDRNAINGSLYKTSDIGEHFDKVASSLEMVQIIYG